MENIDVRAYIINNFKSDDTTTIKKAIDDSISSKEDDPLIGLGVLFEIVWNNSNGKEKKNILERIKKGMTA